MIETYIRAIPDFPKKGIIFRDVTTLFQDHAAFKKMLDQMASPFEGKGINKVVGLEARGFIVGGAIADRLDAGFVAARKKGKLPHECISTTYDLEYGSEELQLHKDSILEGERILIVDDLLATGGTAAAGIELVERLGGLVTDCAFVINLPSLGGADKLKSMGKRIHFICEF